MGVTERHEARFSRRCGRSYHRGGNLRQFDEVNRSRCSLDRGAVRHSPAVPIPTALNRVPVALNQDMRALRPTGRLNVLYLKTLIDGLQRPLLHEWTKQGATVESVEHGYMANTAIPIPPSEEQSAILEYVQRETSTMNGAIRTAQREIDLIRDFRIRLIADIVTGKLDVRGLSPADSGVAETEPEGLDDSIDAEMPEEAVAGEAALEAADAEN